TNLNVLPILSSNVNAEICLGSTYILPNGLTVNEEGNYETILTSSLGCDSLVTSNLSIAPAIEMNVTVQNNILSICFGQSTIITPTIATEFQSSSSECLSAETGSVVIESPGSSIVYFVRETSCKFLPLDSISLNVLPAPTVVLNPSNTSIFFGE